MVGLVVFIGTGEFVLVACLPGAVCLIASNGLEVFTDIGRAPTTFLLRTQSCMQSKLREEGRGERGFSALSRHWKESSWVCRLASELSSVCHIVAWFEIWGSSSNKGVFRMIGMNEVLKE